MAKTRNHRILIATATAGGGHLAAAAAIEEAWLRQRPGDQIKRVDILDYTSRLYRKAYAEGYVLLADRTPELYAHAFRRTDTLEFLKKAGRWRRWGARFLAGKFLKLVDSFRPDVVISPHFLPIETLGSQSGRGIPPVVCVITDFEAHALWIEPCVDFYCVANPETRARLVARGVPAQRIAVTGIPVSQHFATRGAASAERKHLNLKDAGPVVLVLGGGLGMGPLEKIVASLDSVTKPFEMMVVAGKNKKLYETLKTKNYRHSVQIHGFVTNMHQLMKAADLVVTKPGGLTSSEALALGKPLLIVNPLPGQEAANSDYLLQNGAAVKVNRLEDLSFRVKTLLGSPQLARLSRSARDLGRPKAAQQICREVTKRFLLALCVALPLAGAAHSAIKADEEVTLYPAAAWLAADNRWMAEFSGWVGELEKDSALRQTAAARTARALQLPEGSEKNSLFQSRLQYFLADNERAKTFSVKLDGATLALKGSSPNGQFRTQLPLPPGPWPSADASGAPQWKNFELANRQGELAVIPPQGLSVISDIDDTIKISNVEDRAALYVNSFLKDYEPVPGMAALYKEWEKAGAAFHYLSASPSPLYPSLADFLQRHQFPRGTVSLRTFRARPWTLPGYAKGSEDFKVETLKSWLGRFPGRQFILVGDSGERDPEIYGRVARAFPHQIRLIAIRRTSPTSVGPERLAKAFKALPSSRWVIFDSPAEVQTALAAADIEWEKDLSDLTHHRAGLAAVLAYAQSQPTLFPDQALRERRVITREEKEAVWNAWKSFLDYNLALESTERRYSLVPLPGDPAQAASFTLGYAAFLAKYRYSLEWIEKLDRDPGFKALLNEPVPEIGLPKGTYDRLKFRFLNAGMATQFAAQSALYHGIAAKDSSLTPALQQFIEQDAQVIWGFGRGRGERLTLRNAWNVIQNAGFVAWFPVQMGVANWMGDTKVYRVNRALITPEQIEALRSQLQPGDILLERREWYLSNIGLPGFWPHAALYVGTPAEREAFFKMPELESQLRKDASIHYAKSMEAYEGHPPRVLEAISEGVTFTSLEHSAAADTLAVLRPRLTKAEVAEALRRAFRYAGRPYDFNFDFTTDSSIVCSELVYKAYEPSSLYKGIRLDLVTMLGRPVTPPNVMVQQFDRDYGTSRQQFDLVAFLDGREFKARAEPADLAAFRASWRRPKWHIWTNGR